LNYENDLLGRGEENPGGIFANLGWKRSENPNGSESCDAILLGAPPPLPHRFSNPRPRLIRDQCPHPPRSPAPPIALFTFHTPLPPSAPYPYQDIHCAAPANLVRPMFLGNPIAPAQKRLTALQIVIPPQHRLQPWDHPLKHGSTAHGMGSRTIAHCLPKILTPQYHAAAGSIDFHSALGCSMRNQQKNDVHALPAHKPGNSNVRHPLASESPSSCCWHQVCPAWNQSAVQI